ncbi:pre-rRNA-processing protein TSR1 homolog [Salvia hispanica]|uniref:pre-rRNA-processing protein TSR1 homolog n=1 Tax=Salvia hispanica TaxID=49212 RepID=UPI002009D56D|nr:pre-rRNA-processing protein TSR1 homolog [Salvia hispanica]
MGGSRHQMNKSHKTRFASKSSRNVHKISSQDKLKVSKSDGGIGKGAKAARLQRNKMMREQKRAAVLKEKRALSGPSSPPRVIVLFGLSACVDLNAVEEDILSLLSEEGRTTTFPAAASSEYKLRTTVLKAPHGDLVACMEMAKVADLLAFVASQNSLHEADDTVSFIDSFGSQCLSVFRTLGLPSTTVLIRDLPEDLKRRHELKKMCMSVLAPEFPEDCKFYPADKKDELHKFMWLFKEQRLTAPHWRNQRSYLMAQKVETETDDTSSPGKCTLVLTGYIRAHSLSVNQLVHVAGAGDFPLSKIELLKDPCPLNLRKGADLMDSENDIQVLSCLTADPMKQEPLVVENAPDILAGEQTWPTEAEMAEAERNYKEKKMKKKRLPKGISEYQAAWIVDDSDADYSDSEGDDDGMVVDDGENGFPGQKLQNDLEFDEDQASLNLRDSDDETDTESVMMMDGDNLTNEQIAEQIRKIKEEHAEDEEFPDEVDTPIDVPARKRFAKYRGVKSFRTSTWDPKESLPPEYSRIFAFDNFTRTQKHVLAKALDMLQEADECIPVGSYARLYIKDVSAGIASKLCTLSKRLPVVASGLLQHESKISVLHFSIKKHDSYEAPIKAKEELLFHVGFRQFTSRPIFSSDSINASKHKMERFLHPGTFSVASIYAPICFHSLPLVALKSQGEDTYPAVAAVGSLRSVDPDRIILKKIILTGYPQRVSKSKATVRYMFHNPEDVRWFKPVEVWSKCGRRGRIREPVGTHGAMKCILNGVIQQHDTVCMSLFKRSYPKWPQQWFPLNSGSD